ncbi:aspartyl-phosphate phosphatase Spo0E family protein [Bacillus sp. KH172YL63]|uniref:aspartyl-phosphate phosphatase Spo0E family protein n=1 Tax=Bacillus sp. KH172YL63 TaxID=2709784 RepID=UPI0013E43598|nr:aspartyl-phosphate phosphatase Spo0E family protein [Bacillus sp. KH172YL63]BCB05747.1 hypothetical protein KH172YL63_38800 [Bacillus sp. KH172YL63]
MPTKQIVQSIIEEMETKRIQLGTVARIYGFSHPDTVKISQELDDLFNLYQSEKQ